ncbi:hypothetical protein V5E97_05475 [Singulisphaera sp. Ch08]|uniref:Uncharacterized protein n=1 Tax=Singulisphaera sp. Ch08 TaxID=3120278 RepID=A0AAU7CJP5_9BACT
MATALATKRANANAPRFLEHFNRVPGAPFLMASIGSSADYQRSSLASYSTSASFTHNYVFLSLDNQSIRRLLPTNDHYISEAVALPEALDGRPAVDKAGTLGREGVQWWLFDVVKQDTNLDGDFDGQDLHTLGVSDAGGSGYTELIEGITKHYGRTLRDPNTLVVVYESGGTKRVSLIDLPKRTVLSTTSFPDLGSDLK